jgi:hypothetical protein
LQAIRQIDYGQPRFDFGSPQSQLALLRSPPDEGLAGHRSHIPSTIDGFQTQPVGPGPKQDYFSRASIEGEFGGFPVYRGIDPEPVLPMGRN